MKRLDCWGLNNMIENENDLIEHIMSKLDCDDSIVELNYTSYSGSGVVCVLTGKDTITVQNVSFPLSIPNVHSKLVKRIKDRKSWIGVYSSRHGQKYYVVGRCIRTLKYSYAGYVKWTDGMCAHRFFDGDGNVYDAHTYERTHLLKPSDKIGEYKV